MLENKKNICRKNTQNGQHSNLCQQEFQIKSKNAQKEVTPSQIAYVPWKIKRERFLLSMTQERYLWCATIILQKNADVKRYLGTSDKNLKITSIYLSKSLKNKAGKLGFINSHKWYL